MLATGFDNTRSFSVTLFDGAAISRKTYTGYDVNPTLGAFVGVLFSYQDGNGTVYGAGSGAVDGTVTITQLTATAVRGNFRGTLKSAGHPDLPISNGEFFVLRAN